MRDGRKKMATYVISDIHGEYEKFMELLEEIELGHECCAEVVEVGELVKDFKPGDRVLVPAITPDWNSLEAQAGYSMHSGGMLAGWKFSNFKDGVFSEFFHVNDADGNLALLPKNINVVDACMLSDMVPTGFHGVELADVQFGDTVLVIGIGPVGLMSVAGTNMRGASRIIAVGTRPVCVETAKKYGATDFVSYKNGPIFQQVLDMTDGKGVDKVVIAGGGVETFAEAVKCLKPGGKIGNVNYLGSGDNIDIPRVEWGVGMGHKQINGGLMPGEEQGTGNRKESGTEGKRKRTCSIRGKECGSGTHLPLLNPRRCHQLRKSAEPVFYRQQFPL